MLKIPRFRHIALPLLLALAAAAHAQSTATAAVLAAGAGDIGAATAAGVITTYATAVPKTGLNDLKSLGQGAPVSAEDNIVRLKGDNRER